MAFRIEEKALSNGSISNQKKGRVTFSLTFTDGSVVRGDLKGNPYRDMAGRQLTFTNPRANESCALEPRLARLQTGCTGDITAAKKVKVRTSETETSYSWKNSLYLEWYSPEDGRVVLEATELDMTLSEAVWEMTEEEEKEAHQSAAEALRTFFDQLCDLDLERKQNEWLTQNKESLNEFEWEATLRFSERLTQRYNEALEKFGPDGDGEIDEIMGWNITKPTSSQYDTDETEWTPCERGAPGDESKEHPLNLEAFSIIEDYLRKLPSPRTAEADQTRALLSIVAVKLAGALSCLQDGVFVDKGFTIANLKRVLSHIDEALPNTENETRLRLLQLRQTIIDLQQELRKA